MGVVNTAIRTVTCNQCNTSATFEVHQQGVAKETLTQYPWLTIGRIIGTPDGRQYFYCSDKCEIEAAATGVHNPVEQKKIIDAPANAQAIAQAAASAKAAEEANKAIRAGAPAQVTLG